MNHPFQRPGFVHAEAVSEAGGGLRLFAFPGGFRCLSHAGVDETETIYNETVVDREYLRGGVSLDGARCVVDAGANLGLFTLLAKSICPDAIVHACEPMVESLAVIERNVALHGLHSVHLHEVALGDAPGVKEFAYYPNLPCNATSRPDLKEPLRQAAVALLGPEQGERYFDAHRRQVEVRTLSGLMAAAGIESIDLLKVDVEGDELAVLRGIAAGQRASIRQVAVEVHPGVDERQVRRALEEMGLAVRDDHDVISAVAGSFLLYGVRR